MKVVQGHIWLRLSGLKEERDAILNSSEPASCQIEAYVVLPEIEFSHLYSVLEVFFFT